MYTLVTRSQLKLKFFRLSNARVKICEVPHVNFKTTSQFLFNSCFILHCMTHNFSVNFELMHFLLWTIGSHESSNFDTFKCSGENLSNSFHFPINKSIFLQVLHHSSMSWEITSLYFFSSNNIYFVQKLSVQVKICQIPYANFETTS